MALPEPADVAIVGVPAPLLALVICVFAVTLFVYVMSKRIHVLRKVLPDERFDRIPERVKMALLYGFGQGRQPRYFGAGLLHILLFAGFMILSLRSLTMIGLGFSEGFHLPLMGGLAGVIYEAIKDYAVFIVLVVCIIAIVRRAVFHPARYEHPGGGGGHGSEAYVILGAVSALMITDMMFDGSSLVAMARAGEAGMSSPTEFWGMLPAASLGALLMSGVSDTGLSSLHIVGYWAHILVFFGLLNYLPISKHFHVITAIPNVFFAKLDKGSIKPVQYGVDDWMELEEIGAGRFERFTWKNVLDFYSCADCGRCTDNCPANHVGRRLSPKMISIKARDYAYEHYPVLGSGPDPGDKKMAGDIISLEEIWACTTCGACEQECPIFIEYIDKIVDMRRYLIEQGEMPQSLQKPMQQIKKKGNAYGGTKTKRAAWTKDLEEVEVKVLKAGASADLLFFVDSCGSFDPRIQEISKSFARILHKAGADFGILGPDETDSGNEIRRLGEEGLFEQVSEKNIAAFESRDFKEIVSFDPHAFNVIKNDYPTKFPIVHSSQLMARYLTQGKLRLSGDYLAGRRVTTYHDPCYLGRHKRNLRRPEKRAEANTRRQTDRDGTVAFEEFLLQRRRLSCLWYENEEEKERMGEVRVRMAADAGAEVIVTACPFCLINLEDAVKTTGNEGKIEVIDMVELVDRYVE